MPKLSSDPILYRSALYPWEHWFSKRLFLLERGIHFSVPTTIMDKEIRNEAVRRKISISIDKSDDGDLIVVHVLERKK